MGQSSGTDKAIRNIMKWTDRPEWSDEMAAVVDAHLSPLCDRVGISKEELAEALAESGYEGMLFGIRSKKGREKVIEWLKHLENNELRRADHQGQTPYDSSWMWDELKLSGYRD